VELFGRVRFPKRVTEPSEDGKDTSSVVIVDIILCVCCI
jgi:hypothetical protein